MLSRPEKGKYKEDTTALKVSKYHFTAHFLMSRKMFELTIQRSRGAVFQSIGGKGNDR